MSRHRTTQDCPCGVVDGKVYPVPDCPIHGSQGSPSLSASLRKQASRGGRAIDGGYPFTPVRDNVLLALLDVAEATAAYVAEPTIENDRLLGVANLALHRTLAG